MKNFLKCKETMEVKYNRKLIRLLVPLEDDEEDNGNEYELEKNDGAIQFLYL